MDLPVRRTRDGVELRVRLTPRSSADRIEGLAESSDGTRHLAARVRAVPEKGAANAALERLIAAWLDVPARDVSVTAGATARIKVLRVTGDPDALTARIADLLKSA